MSLNIAVFGVYLLFALGLLLLKHRLSTGRAIQPIIIVPILMSFMFGMGLLMYALTQI